MTFWIARDKDGRLFFWSKQPGKGSNMFGHPFRELYSSLLTEHLDIFPEVTFENSPQEVELKLIKNDF